MPFQFRWLCELFEDLHNSRYKRTLTVPRKQSYEQQVLYRWYQRYSHRIERTGASAIAFLSCLLPERRPDRVYNLQAKRLSHIIGRALGLGSSRALELNRWQDQDGTDFATCVERVLQQCENITPLPGKEVSLEEIDEILELIAAHCPSSSAAIRIKRSSTSTPDLLAPVLHRLKSNEAKWLVRMLLKSYAPVQVPEYEALKGFHFMLPDLLAIQNSFHAAIIVLSKKEICQLPPRPDKSYELSLRPLLSEHVQPQLGVMIRRQPYHKARSIKHCCALAGARQMSIERKYDGEYCQIHVDLSKGQDCVQIFSKSGRDSTEDRNRLQNAIKDALRIDSNGCRIRSRCIVEGELLIWSSASKRIQPFHKIRRYVKHGGRQIGTARDSPSRSDEHLMVAFYDILMLDDIVLLHKPHKLRRQYLKAVLHTTEGRAILCERRVIDFQAKHAESKLRDMFARAITQRWEGLVLKGLKEPYFSWDSQNHGIKLKKDYISRLGDIADLCVVGGRRDPQVELQIGLGHLSWTSFYLGAVCNLEAVRRFDQKPQIKIIDILTHHSMPNAEFVDLNRLGQLFQVDFQPHIAEFDVEMGSSDILKPTTLFKRPFIVEIMGAGFEKPSNSSFFTLRFPRKVNGSIKLHTDRTLSDTTSFSELQSMAERSLDVPQDRDSQEDAQWIERLIRADGKNRTCQSVSQESSSAKTPTSASTISLSPIEKGRRTNSTVFVRPDTEEPETQITAQSTRSLSTQCDFFDGSPQQPILPATRSFGGNCQGIQKRSMDFTKDEIDVKAGNKRLCLSAMRTDGGSIRGDITIERTTTLEFTTRSSTLDRVGLQQQTTSTQRVEMESQITRTSHSLLEAHTPNRRATTSTSQPHYIEDLLLTPDSTLVMRQILSGCVHLSPTATKNKRTENTSNTEELQAQTMNFGGVHQFSNSAPAVLPTPPTSSPLSAIETGRVPKSISLVPTELLQKPLQAVQSKDPTSTDSARNKQQTQVVHPLTSTLEKITSPTLISSVSQHHISQQISTEPPILFLNSPPDLKLETALTNLKTSVTFSLSHFFDHLDHRHNRHKNHQPSTPPHPIILVNLHTPLSTATRFEYLARTLQSRLETSTPILPTRTHAPDTLTQALQQYNANDILVFDHTVLTHHHIHTAATINADVLGKLDYGRGRGQDAELFCGVLRFYELDGRLKGEDSITEGSIGTDGRDDAVDGKDARRLKIGVRLEYRFDWIQQAGYERI